VQRAVQLSHHRIGQGRIDVAALSQVSVGLFQLADLTVGHRERIVNDRGALILRQCLFQRFHGPVVVSPLERSASQTGQPRSQAGLE